MKIRKIFPSLIVFYFLTQSCSILDITRTNLNDLDWLVGEWHSADSTNVTIEKWEKLSDITYEGIGETKAIKTNQIINYESLRLVFMSDDIFYVAKVSHNKYPVAFKLINTDNSILVFENQDHDFPTKITYEKVEKNRMSVTVGNTNREFSLEFIRQ